MSRSIKTKTLRIILCLLMAIALLPLISNTAEAAERREEFVVTKGPQDAAFTYTGTHFEITGDDGGDQDGVFITPEKTMTVASTDGTVITKLVMTRSYYTADGTLADKGTVTVSGNTITVTGINDTSVTISHADGDGFYKYVQINNVKVYYEDDDILAENITLDSESLELEEGDTAVISATVTPDNATYTVANITWKSSDESVATVDQNGKVTAVGEGEADISATITNGSDYTDDDVTVTCKVTVKNLVVISNIELKIDAPVGGDKVTADHSDPDDPDSPYNWLTQNPKPKVTSLNNDVELTQIQGEKIALWLNEEEGVFAGTFVGGKKYRVMGVIQPKEGYKIADEFKLTINGTEVTDFYSNAPGMVLFTYTVTAVKNNPPYIVPDTSVK